MISLINVTGSVTLNEFKTFPSVESVALYAVIVLLI